MFLRSNDELVDYLVYSKVIKNPAVESAFRAVDRKLFVPVAWQHQAYGDHPLPIGYGQTISQPTTVAMMIELLKPAKGHKVLEIGAGSGYVAALLAHIVGEGGSVFAIERITELCNQAEKSLKHFSYKQLKLLCGDGKNGYAPDAPYHRILLSAAPSLWPSQIENQLTNDGIMVAPVGSHIQEIVVAHRTNGKSQYKRYQGFVFVPLV